MMYMMFRNTWTMTEMQVCSFEDAKRVAKTDIRTNVARERGKWEADHAAQVKRVWELEEKAKRLDLSATDWARAYRDASREVERLQAEARTERRSDD